jgi:hypothetical protein
MDKNEVKKDLYKSKVNAKFAYYCHGSLYYNVEVLGSIYQFPIETLEDGTLSNDLGTTPFNAEIKASDLNRWIAEAIDKDAFIKIG